MFWLPGLPDPVVPGFGEPGLFGGFPCGGAAPVPCVGAAPVPGEDEQPTNEPKTNEPNKRRVIRERIQLLYLKHLAARAGGKGQLMRGLPQTKGVSRITSAGEGRGSNG